MPNSLLCLCVGTLVALTAGANQNTPSSTIEERKGDLLVFRQQFMARDVSFSTTARAAAERRLAALESSLTSISQLAFELELARIAALADNGHTHVGLARIAERHNRVPLRFLPFGGDFHVVRAAAGHADLLGARLLSIDRHPASTIREAARQLWGGPAHFRDQFAYSLIESPEWLATVGLADEPTAALYRLETRTGQVVERRIDGDPPSAARPTSAPGRTLAPEPMAGEQHGWATVLNPAQAPWALREVAVPFRWRPEPDLGGLVLQLRRNSDAPNRTIADALSEFREAIERATPTHLVLDLRWNGGGDLNTTRAFMQWLPSRVPGRLVVLTGPLTFSAAIASLGYLKQAAPERVVVVGEPIGDRLEFFAEGRPVELPHSRLVVSLATERHDYRHGCRGFTDCHRAVVRAPIAVESLAPAVAAPWTIGSYAAGGDPAMEAAIAVVRR